MINGNNRSAWGAPRSRPARPHDHGTPAAFAPFRPRSPREARQRRADGVHLRRTAQPGPAGGPSARLTACAEDFFPAPPLSQPPALGFHAPEKPGVFSFLWTNRGPFKIASD